MPAIVDFEHEDIYFEVASGAELGMPGLSIRCGDDGRIQFAVSEKVPGKAADISRVDANSVLIESVHMDLQQTGGGLTARAVAKDRYGHVTESEELQKSDLNGSNISEIVLSYPSGQLKEAINTSHWLRDPNVFSRSSATDGSGRLLRTSEINANEIAMTDIESSICRDSYGRTSKSKEIMRTQMQAGSIVGDYIQRDAIGRNERTIHFSELLLFGGASQVDAVVRDSAGKVTEKIRMDCNPLGSGVTKSQVVVNDSLGRTKETFDVNVRQTPRDTTALIVRKSGLGQVLERMEITVKR
jgi:hypothetical protein